jgi:hypothetical protein
MHRLLLLASLILLACPSGGSFGTPDDDDDDLVDDDDPVDDDDSSPLGPEGSIRGSVIDVSTGELRIDVPVTELDSDPPNAANTGAEDGFFVLEPVSWSPAQLWAGGEGYMEAGVVVTEETYLGVGRPLEMQSWPRQDAIDWIESTFQYEWDPSIGLLVLVIHTPDPEDAVGFTATLSAPAVGPFYFDGKGYAVDAGALRADADRPWIAWVGVGHGPTTLEVTPSAGLSCVYPEDIEALGDAFVFVPVLCE